MHANASVVTSTGIEAELRPGDLVGRLWSAALRLDDPRISEAHALVTLRGTKLVLQALRGPLSLDSVPVSEVVLRPGLVLELCEQLSIRVQAVSLPERVLAIEGLGPDPMLLSASVYTFKLEPQPTMVPRYEPVGAAWLWTSEQGWTLQNGAQLPVAVVAGEEHRVGRTTLKVVEVPLASSATTATRLSGRGHPALRILARHDTVLIHPEGRPVVSVSGLPARILSDVMCIGIPVAWSVIAAEIWSEDDPAVLRQRWDRNLSLLRAKLREARIRRDLVRSDGTGNVEAVLMPGDVVVDET